MFLFFRLAYESSHGSFTLQKFFWAYLIVPAWILLAHLTVMNADSYKTMPELEEKVEREQDATRDVGAIVRPAGKMLLTKSRCTILTTSLATARFAGAANRDASIEKVTLPSLISL